MSDKKLAFPDQLEHYQKYIPVSKWHVWCHSDIWMLFRDSITRRQWQWITTSCRLYSQYTLKWPVSKQKHLLTLSFTSAYQTYLYQFTTKWLHYYHTVLRVTSGVNQESILLHLRLSAFKHLSWFNTVASQWQAGAHCACITNSCDVHNKLHEYNCPLGC